MDRKEKNKEGAKGDDNDHDIGRNKGNGDGTVLSWENGFQNVDNMEGKKKNKKKKKEKGSKKERDECAVSGHVAKDDGGDANLGVMEIGGHVVENWKKGEELGEPGKNKKKKEKRSRRERDEHLSSGHVMENEGSDTYLRETDVGSSGGKDGEKVEVLLEHCVGLKGGTKKWKEERSITEWKDGKQGTDVQGLGTHESSLDVEVIENIEKKKKKLKKGQSKKDLGKVRIADAICAEEDMEKEARKKKRKREKEKTLDDSMGVLVAGENHDKEVLEGVRRKKRKTDNVKNKKLANDLVSCEGTSTSEMETKDGEISIISKGKGKPINQSENTNAKKGKKKVSFSGQVEIFPVSSDSINHEKKDEEENLVRGKRFSAEEDKIIEQAVYDYIQERGLGEEGVDMVLHCRAHPEVKDCWNHIAKAIPYRPRTSVYFRAQILFKRGEKRKWSEEDCELLRKLQEKHGNKWKVMAEEFGRHRYHVKDAWRRLKVLNKNKGHWSQKEYQALFDLVNTDLRLKISEDAEKKSKHGMLRDNIHWSAISDNLATRTGPNCCMKWYNQLSSPMVAQGIWADSDDYRLINELFSLDASCMEDVDWDNLVAHRSGDLCRDRWNQMVLHIGNRANKSFSEQVDILAKRYCPDLIEVREAWEKKPVVD